MITAALTAAAPGLARPETPKSMLIGTPAYERLYSGAAGSAPARNGLVLPVVYVLRTGDGLLLGGGLELGIRFGVAGPDGAAQAYPALPLEIGWDLGNAILQLSVGPALLLGPLPAKAGGSRLGLCAGVTIGLSWWHVLGLDGPDDYARKMPGIYLFVEMLKGLTALLPSGIGVRIEHLPGDVGVRPGLMLTWLWPTGFYDR